MTIPTPAERKTVSFWESKNVFLIYMLITFYFLPYLLFFSIDNQNTWARLSDNLGKLTVTESSF